MLPQTVHAILAEHRRLRQWKSSFLLNTEDGVVDLSQAIGAEATPLFGLPYQPTRYPLSTTYCFDSRLYQGEAATKQILNDVACSIADCSMNFHRQKTTDLSPFTTFSLRCSFCRVVDASYTKRQFTDKSFAKIETLTEPIKRRRESDKLAPDRMDTSKMNRSKHKRKQKKSSTKKRNTALATPSPKRRTLGTRALTSDTKCGVAVHLRHYHNSGNWYLSKSSCLQHTHHTRLDPVHRRVRRKDVSDVELDFAQLFHDQGANIDCITRAMNQLRFNSGVIGNIKKVTMRNLIRKNKIDLDSLKGIPRDWSVAEKTLEYLKDMDASYIALVMDEKDNLLVYKGKGRHTRDDAQSIATDGHLRKKLSKIRRTLKLSKTSHILLALSVATDGMIRAMHMNPEVQFLDVAANMNSQKREMFFAVVKGPNGKTYITNATVMPCGRGWIFLKIYQTFFLYLYGKTAIERIQLVLTDDDSSSYGALNDVKILDNCWEGVVHMLCVFHALVMAFHKTVWPKLPHKRNNPYELTKKGKLYCTFLRPLRVHPTYPFPLNHFTLIFWQPLFLSQVMSSTNGCSCLVPIVAPKPNANGILLISCPSYLSPQRSMQFNAHA